MFEKLKEKWKTERERTLESRIVFCEARMDAMETSIASLRNTVNRKFVGGYEEQGAEVRGVSKRDIDEIKAFFGNPIQQAYDERIKNQSTLEI